MLSLQLAAVLLLILWLELLEGRNQDLDIISWLGRALCPLSQSLPFPGCLQGARLFICIFPIVCNSHNIHKEGRYNYPYLQMNKLRQVKKLAYLPICLLVLFTNLSGSSCSLTRLVIKPIFQRMKQRPRLQNLFLYFWDSRRVLRFDTFAPSAGGCRPACVSPAPRHRKRPNTPSAPPKAPAGRSLPEVWVVVASGQRHPREPLKGGGALTANANLVVSNAQTTVALRGEGDLPRASVHKRGHQCIEPWACFPGCF